MGKIWYIYVLMSVCLQKVEVRDHRANLPGWLWNPTTMVTAPPSGSPATLNPTGELQQVNSEVLLSPNSELPSAPTLNRWYM
jgi:hypothetical protein